jgi:steroid delta-isomerase-like uncharacterized protein
MPTPAQAKAIERYSTEIWGQGNLDLVDEIFASDYVRHGPDIEGEFLNGAKSLKELVTLFRTAMPDLKVPVVNIVGEGDIVLSRWVAKGTNTGELLGLPPTGLGGEVGGFWMHRFEGDTIVEEWATWDTQGYLAQIGVTLPG